IARPVPVALATALAELGLEAVVVPATHQLAPCDLAGEAADRFERAGEVVVGIAARGVLPERRHLRQDRVDRAIAVEAAVATPGRREVPSLGELPGGRAQD